MRWELVIIATGQLSGRLFTKLKFGAQMFRRICRTIAVTMLTLFAVTSSKAALADYEQAKAAFLGLDKQDQSLIVVGLIVSGDFAGLIDYGFTRRLYRAILSFETREGFNPDGVISAQERKTLNQVTDDFFDPLKLETIRHPSSGAEMPLPRAVFDSSSTTEAGLAFERNDESLSLNLVAYPSSERSFSDLYERFSSNTNNRMVSYSVKRDGYFVATGQFKGREFYTMMLNVPFGTTGFTLTWTKENDDFARKLSIYLANSINVKDKERSAIGEDADIFSGNSDSTTSVTEEGPSYGTGFFISAKGHLITNSHVVDKCKSVRIKMLNASWINADVVTQRTDLDLALLKAYVGSSEDFAKIRPSFSVRIGDDAVAFGFPLVGALSTQGSLSIGAISSLSGLGDDSSSFQISVPVQPGNSGGPLIDRFGNVIGVVVAKLNAIEVAKVTGDIPQNVNFAIKSDVLIKFLEWAGTGFEIGSATVSQSNSEIGADVQRYSSLIECAR